MPLSPDTVATLTSLKPMLARDAEFTRAAGDDAMLTIIEVLANDLDAALKASGAPPAPALAS